MKINAYSGKIGAGKSYMVSQDIQRIKSMGNRIFILSFADPIKNFLEDEFGLIKGADPEPRSPHCVSTWITSEAWEKRLKVFLEMNMGAILDDGHYDFDTYKYYGDRIQAVMSSNVVPHCFGLLRNYKDNPVDCYRMLMQQIGTEIAQSVYELIWVERALQTVEKIRAANVAKVVMFDDVRFLKEYDGIHQYVHNKNDVNLIFKMITASETTRCERTGLTLAQLVEMSDHPSETEIDLIAERIPKTCFVDND
jgi:hypothetical protein